MCAVCVLQGQVQVMGRPVAAEDGRQLCAAYLLTYLPT